jgi:uncharacterized protein
MSKSATERVTAVDTLRGVALAGMLVVHFQYYAEGPAVWGERVQAMVDLLFTTRFYALFAFLFGVGFALQVERAGDRPGFVWIYTRRLLALAVFAVLLLAFTGYHVLHDYAFWGFALLLIRRWSTRALAALAIAIILLTPAVLAVQWQLESRTIGVAASNEAVRHERLRWQNYHRVEDELRARGDFGAVVAHRLSFHGGAFLRWQRYVPGGDTLMFVFGLLAVRIGVLRRPAEHRRLLWTAVIAFGALGLASNVPAQLGPRFGGESLRLTMAWNAVQWGIANEMFQGLAYGAAILLWVSRTPTSPSAAALLAVAGRMSLTNYVVQICVLELVFAVGGVAITRSAALIATAAFFLVQIAYSRWWLRRYRMGPLEWLWRSLTYWRIEPLRLPSSAVIVSV